MKQYKIRSLTLHYPVYAWDKLESELSKASEILEDLNRFLAKSSDLSVWTTRLTLSTPPSEIPLNHIIKSIERIGLDVDKVLISIGSLRPDDKRVEELRESIEYGIYSYIMIDSWESIGKVSSLIRKWSNEPYEHMTRLGLDLLGDPSFVTPYYPLSQSPKFINRPSLSAAILLPNLMLKAYENDGFKGLIEKLYDTSKNVYKIIDEKVREYGQNLGFLGIDLSLSPWMEESVGQLIERIGSCTIGDLECIPVIYALNKTIEFVATLLPKSVGFNEIMFAVGEDNLLKTRAYEERLQLRSLLEIVPVCLAGIDMVAIKTDEKKLSSLLSVLKSYSQSKNKTVGFRAIILPKDFEEKKIDTRKFGDIPVLDF